MGAGKPNRMESALRRNVLRRSVPSRKRGSESERNAVLPVGKHHETKRNPAMNARIGKNGDTVLTEEKRDFPFLTAKIVSHIKKAFSIEKSAFFNALDRAFLSEKRLTSKNL